MEREACVRRARCGAAPAERREGKEKAGRRGGSQVGEARERVGRVGPRDSRRPSLCASVAPAPPSGPLILFYRLRCLPSANAPQRVVLGEVPETPGPSRSSERGRTGGGDPKR